jgi:hypothetical protein
MTYEKLENGLKDRGFEGIDGISNMGDCHKNKKHYILYTDGLIIYSNIPFWTNEKYHPNAKVQIWGFDFEDDKDKKFTFEELDEILNNDENCKK